MLYSLIATESEVYAKVKASGVHNVNITVDEVGDVAVEYNIHIVNKSKDFFIRDYSLVTAHTDLIGVKVLENGQRAEFKKEHTNGKVRIRVILKKQLIYEGDSADIYIKYNTRQLYKTEGLQKILSIPSIKTEEETSRVRYKLKIHKNLGEPSYISLRKNKLKENGRYWEIEYHSSAAPSGIVMVFGDRQQFEFTYTYKIRNNEEGVKRYTITLPPDSQFQNTNYLKIAPYPERVIVDEDGNTIAEYVLNGGEEVEIIISGYTVYKDRVKKLTIDEESKKEYMLSSEIWDFLDEEIKTVINKNTRGDYSEYENALFLYEYLVSNYDYVESGESSDLTVTQMIDNRKKLSCENFTDFYTALLRGARIPARKVIGYTTLQSSINMNHSWVEFYDEKKGIWVIADPCLDKQKGYYAFDKPSISRMILAYRSKDARYPYVIQPLSNYQDTNIDTLDIKVTSYEYQASNSEVNFSFDIGRPDVFFKKIPLIMKIDNNSANVFRFNEVRINGESINFADEHRAEYMYEGVFPHSSREISLNLYDVNDFSPEHIENYTLLVDADFGLNSFTREAEFDVKRPFTFIHGLSLLIAFILSLGIIALFLVSFKRVRYFYNFRRKRDKYNFRRSKIGDFL